MVFVKAELTALLLPRWRYTGGLFVLLPLTIGNHSFAETRAGSHRDLVAASDVIRHFPSQAR